MPSPADISLVIPVYNGAGTLTRALSSVFAQTIVPTEVIVVDDGSTDGSADVAQGFGDRVRILRQPNAGVSAARNRGVAECKSGLIAFLDADDDWMPRFLETIHRLLLAHPDCGMYCTSCVRRFADGAEVPYLIRGLPSSSLLWTGVIPDYFRIASMSDPPIHSSAVVVRKELLNAVGGFPVGVTIGEDILTWARLAARQPVAYASQPFARFWQPTNAAPGILTRPTRVPQKPDVVGQKLRELLPLLPATESRSLRLYVGLWHKMRASCFIRAGHPFSAWREMCLALLATRLSPQFVALAVQSLFRSVPGIGRAVLRDRRP